jgi:MEMO1 family protein
MISPDDACFNSQRKEYIMIVKRMGMNIKLKFKEKKLKPYFKIQRFLILLCGFALLSFNFAFAVVEGQFYPADKNELSRDIDNMLKPYKVIKGDGDLLGIIVPHAGYQYSGNVAAYAYKQLTNKQFDTVIVIGPSHYMAFDGISIIPSGEYETPLGKIRVDADVATKMISYNPKISYVKEAWDKEHSVEVQIPFIQKTLKNCQIVPVVIGNQSLENCSILAEAILRAIGKKRVLIVASTDLSHYHTAEVAGTLDATAVDAISKGDVNTLVSKLTEGQCEMCGYGAVISTMLVCDSLGATSYEILKYADTGDATGDKSSVVGYLSAAIYRRPLKLDEYDKMKLLKIARDRLDEKIGGLVLPPTIVYEKNLQAKAGVFVTLKKNNELRGCIGYIKPVKPLSEAVAEMAQAAALSDARFTPVASSELPDINIEISVLSPLTVISDTKEVVIGETGLYIVSGGASGLLLPQVAVENKWNRAEFLKNLCFKAGLDQTALLDTNTRIYKFTADVFSEKDQ